MLQNLWVLLKEYGISVKALVAVISHFIHGGKSKTSNLEERLHALQAASLYLLLLKIPGKNILSDNSRMSFFVYNVLF